MNDEQMRPNFQFSMLRGLRNDLKNVVKFYRSDFVDIFKDRKSQFKALSTTIFLYFTCILPTIAFGSVNDKNTDGMIDAQKALIGQFLGGIIFALFRYENIEEFTLLNTLRCFKALKLNNLINLDLSYHFPCQPVVNRLPLSQQQLRYVYILKL